MKIERNNDEIIVRLPASLDISELQNIIDFIDYKEQTAASQVSQSDIDELSKEVNRKIWAKFQERHKLK